MNKVDLILESFDLNPLDANIEPYYTQAMFEDGQKFLSDSINGARTGATKKNIIQRLWETIKKIFAWCVKQWNRFMSWLRKVFRKGRNRKTADQIAGSILGDGSPQIHGTDGNAKLLQAPKGTASDTGGISSIKVNIPSNPASEAPPEPSIDVLIKPIMISYDSVKDAVGISINGALTRNEGKVKGQSSASKSYPTLLLLIDRPDIFEKLKNACTILQSGKIDYEFVRALDAFNQAVYGYTVNKNWVVPFSKLENFQKSLNDIMEMIGNTNISDDTSFLDGNVRQRFNSLAEYCAKLQMAMNSFTRVAAEVHMIDASYIGTVKTQETLDQFVKAMIDSGIPPKYIGYNTYLACDVSIKGTEGDENNPIWGQSRLVLFPQTNKDDVIKVALSGWGIQSNRSEYKTSDLFVKNGGNDFISITKSISSTGATVTAERVNPNGRSLGSYEVKEFINRLNHFITKNKIPFAIDGDLHGGNIGTKQGKIVAIDYAWSERRNPNAPIPNKA